jgi:Uma2 family endonuclease
LPLRENAHDLLLKHISRQLEQQQLTNIHVLPLDMRVQTPEPTYIYYPGVCLSHQAVKLDQAVTREPVVIIELVTPTTERMILHEKSLHYQRIPTLKQIIYIWPNMKIAQVDVRDDTKKSTWTRNFFGINDRIPLPSSCGQGELILMEIFNSMVSIMREISNFIDRFD